MSKDTGGLAFPYEERNGDGQPVRDYFGMTLRDYLAAKAMQGMVASAEHNEPINLHGAAEWSYNMADAMLAARSNT